MKKIFTNKIVLYILGILLFIGVWELIALIINDRIMVFPGPFDTLKSLITLLGQFETYKSIFATMAKMIVGFLGALLISVIVGGLAGEFKKLQLLFKPTITAIKSIPTAALIFIFLLVVGAKNTPVLMVFLVSFPILYESIVGGYNNINKNILDALQIDGTNWFYASFKIKFPLALRYLLVGIASSFALSFKIEIMSEIISGNDALGIGSAIKNARIIDPSDIRPVFAYSLLAIMIMFILDMAAQFIKKLNKN